MDVNGFLDEHVVKGRRVAEQLHWFQKLSSDLQSLIRVTRQEGYPRYHLPCFYTSNMRTCSPKETHTSAQTHTHTLKPFVGPFNLDFVPELMWNQTCITLIHPNWHSLNHCLIFWPTSFTQKNKKSESKLQIPIKFTVHIPAPQRTDILDFYDLYPFCG